MVLDAMANNCVTVWALCWASAAGVLSVYVSSIVCPSCVKQNLIYHLLSLLDPLISRRIFPRRCLASCVTAQAFEGHRCAIPSPWGEWSNHHLPICSLLTPSRLRRTANRCSLLTHLVLLLCPIHSSKQKSDENYFQLKILSFFFNINPIINLYI